jgi:hypothetical protein
MPLVQKYGKWLPERFTTDGHGFFEQLLLSLLREPAPYLARRSAQGDEKLFVISLCRLHVHLSLASVLSVGLMRGSRDCVRNTPVAKTRRPSFDEALIEAFQAADRPPDVGSVV